MARTIYRQYFDIYLKIKKINYISLKRFFLKGHVLFMLFIYTFAKDIIFQYALFSQQDAVCCKLLTLFKLNYN